MFQTTSPAGIVSKKCKACCHWPPLQYAPEVDPGFRNPEGGPAMKRGLLKRSSSASGVYGGLLAHKSKSSCDLSWERCQQPSHYMWLKYTQNWQTNRLLIQINSSGAFLSHRGTLKSSISVGSFHYQPFGGTSFMETPMWISLQKKQWLKLAGRYWWWYYS